MPTLYMWWEKCHRLLSKLYYTNYSQVFTLFTNIDQDDYLGFSSIVLLQSQLTSLIIKFLMTTIPYN